MRYIFIFILSLLAFWGCGPKKLVVRNADTLIKYQIEKKIPLYSAQKEKLGKDLSEILNRLKPEIKKLIPQLRELPQTTDLKAQETYAQIEKIYEKIEANFTVLLSYNLAQLDQKQQKDFLQKMEQDTKKLAEKSDEATTEDAEKAAKEFLGTLSQKQIEILKQYGPYFRKRREAQVEHRRKLHAEFKKIYQGDHNQEIFAQAFKTYQLSRREGSELLTLIKSFIPTVSPEQREHLKKKSEEAQELVLEFLKTTY